MNCCTNELMHCVDNRYIPGFLAFTAFTPVIPENYWNIDSAEQRYFALCKQIQKLACYAQFTGEKVNANKDLIDALYAQFEEFKAHGFDDYYAAQIEQWIADNMTWIIEQSIKMVFFGLTLNGYFVAYIPDSWDDIVFDTGMVYGQPEYGRLILSMQVDDTFQVQGQPNLDH